MKDNIYIRVRQVVYDWFIFQFVSIIVKALVLALLVVALFSIESFVFNINHHPKVDVIRVVGFICY